MKLPHVSIIMPAFNALPWLGQAVSSVCLQTGVSWELLIIDDFSTDGTLELAKQYATEDDRIRVLVNSGQKGIGGARNTGLAAAKGEACVFLDSDDALFPGALEELRKEMETSGLPMVRGVGAQFCMHRWRVFPIGLPENGAPGQGLSYPLSSFWLHMFRMDFLRDHGLLFPDDLILGEDRAFLCQAYARVSQVSVIDRTVYLYRINHKPVIASGAHSLAFLSYLERVRGDFEQNGRRDWVAPYLERTLLRDWMRHRHATRSESREQALRFLELCGKLMSGLEDELRPALLKDLEADGPDFLSCLGAGDVSGMLTILERSGKVIPSPVFIGITRNTQGFSWQAYRFLSRIRNLALAPDSWRTTRYWLRLRRSAARGRALPKAASSSAVKANHF